MKTAFLLVGLLLALTTGLTLQAKQPTQAVHRTANTIRLADVNTRDDRGWTPLMVAAHTATWSRQRRC